jgi:uncharacterized membrane protein YobD (UPF0266 family)
MTITDLVLILFIAALLAFAIYDQFIMPRRNGPTLLAIPLLRRGRIDSVIFVGLIVILIYNNWKVLHYSRVRSCVIRCVFAVMKPSHYCR